MMVKAIFSIVFLALLASAQAQDGFQFRLRFSLGGDDDSVSSPMMGQDSGFGMPSFMRRLSMPLMLRNMFDSSDQQQQEEEPALRIIRIVSDDDDMPEESNPMATMSRMFMRLRGLIQSVEQQQLAGPDEVQQPQHHGCPLRRACQDDVERLCADAVGVPGAVPRCLQSNMERLSEQCSTMLQRFMPREEQSGEAEGDADADTDTGADEESEESSQTGGAAQEGDQSETVSVSSSSESSSSSSESSASDGPKGPCSEDASRHCAGVTDKREILQCLLRAEMESHDLSVGCHAVLMPIIGHAGREVRPSPKIAKPVISARPDVPAASPAAQAPSIQLSPLLVAGAALTVLGVIVVLVHRRRRRRRPAAESSAVTVQLANPLPPVEVAQEEA